MSSATEAVGNGQGALFPSSDQPPFQLWRGQVGPGVEELQEWIAALVHRRQRMRTSGASRASLERPGLTMAEAQLALAAFRALPADPEQAGAATSEVFVESLNAPALADLVEELRCASVGEAVREGHEQNRREHHPGDRRLSRL